MANFKGTNIPLSTLDALKAEDPGKYDRIVEHLKTAIDNNDSRDANEAIMEIAFYSMQKPGKEEYGVGPGNPNVSKIHTSEWRLDAGAVSDYAPWAVDHNNSSGDVYKLHSGIPSGEYLFEPGDIVTYDDQKGIGVNGKIVNSWGQRGHVKTGDKYGLDNPHVGQPAAAPTNPVYSGDASDADLKSIWPDIDWGGGQGDTDLEQYDYWPTQNVGGGGTGILGDYGPTVTKGLFGFSDKDPADLAKPAYNYLNAYGIGSNLAYKPWHSAAWRGPETEEEKAVKRTYYGGIPGGTDARDQLYHYGGSQQKIVKDAAGNVVMEDGKPKTETLLQPMQVPGGWKTAELPEGSQSYYPIARTPLFPSGAISPRGAVAPYVKPPVEPVVPVVPSDPDNPGAGAGKILSSYMGRTGAFGGTQTGGQNLMFRVTSDPTKRDIGDGKTSWGKMGVDLWQDGTLFQTTAYRAMQDKDWTDADNAWVLRRTAEMGSGPDEGGLNLPNIKFATWSGGTPTIGPYVGTPSLKFLGDPQNRMVYDPTTNMGTVVPYTLPTKYGSAWSTGGSEFLDPTKLGTTLDQMWGQPSGMRTTGFDRATDLGGKWVMPGIYGYGEERGGDAGDRYSTENLLGYGLPEFMLNE